jgi:3'-5' exonuclease
MNGSVIVWDLETVPDLRGFAAANGLAGKTDEEVREAVGDKFPKHIYHSIVCIGALVARREDDHWAIDALGASPLALQKRLGDLALRGQTYSRDRDRLSIQP